VLGTAETDPMQLTYGQRMGQAFCELLEHLPTDELPHHGVGNATIVVTIDSDKLACGVGEAILTTGTAVSAAQCRRLACNAGLLPLVLGADSASSTSAVPDDCSTATNASRLRSETKAACSPAAIGHLPGAKPTTSPAGQTADPPTWPTAACSAASTTT
jgi:hypothetical protein